MKTINFDLWVISLVFFLIYGITVKSQLQENCRLLCKDNNCTCPNGLFLLKEKSPVNEPDCEHSTTTVRTTTTDYYNQSSSPLNIEDENRHYRCLTSCPTGYYENSTECEQCNPLCSNCTGSGYNTDACTCRYGENNGTCISKADKGGIGIEVIAGAAAGGGAALIIIIVVIVICVCRRGRESDKKQKSRMSVLIESRDNTIDNRTHIVEDPKPTTAQRKIPTLTRPNYENTGRFDDSKVANQAQQNQDKIFRYVKEPSVPNQRKAETGNRDSGLYGNADAIRLHRNISSDDVELSMLGEAPKPPGHSKSKTKSRNVSHKQGIVNPIVSTTDEQENYEDMSGQPNYTAFDPHEDEQEDYENYQKQTSDDEPLEDYENFGKTSSVTIQSKDDEEEQEDYENMPKNLTLPKKDDDDELDDYENAAAAVKSAPPPIKPKPKAKQSGALQSESPYMNVGDIRG